MAYCGYTQVLCSKGHLHIWGDLDEPYDIDEWRCHCGSKVAWTDCVDETNENAHPGATQLDVLTPASNCTCEKCGNTHTLENATYKIPLHRGMVHTIKTLTVSNNTKDGHLPGCPCGDCLLK